MSDRALPNGLVVLKFGPNEFVLDVTDQRPERLSLNYTDRTWTYAGITHPIGTGDVPSRLLARDNHVIGVFDSRQLDQLKRMVQLAAEIEADRSGGAHGP